MCVWCANVSVLQRRRKEVLPNCWFDRWEVGPLKYLGQGSLEGGVWIWVVVPGSWIDDTEMTREDRGEGVGGMAMVMVECDKQEKRNVMRKGQRKKVCYSFIFFFFSSPAECLGFIFVLSKGREFASCGCECPSRKNRLK